MELAVVDVSAVLGVHLCYVQQTETGKVNWECLKQGGMHHAQVSKRVIDLQDVNWYNVLTHLHIN